MPLVSTIVESNRERELRSILTHEIATRDLVRYYEHRILHWASSDTDFETYSAVCVALRTIREHWKDKTGELGTILFELELGGAKRFALASYFFNGHIQMGDLCHVCHALQVGPSRTIPMFQYNEPKTCVFCQKDSHVPPRYVPRPPSDELDRIGFGASNFISNARKYQTSRGTAYSILVEMFQYFDRVGEDVPGEIWVFVNRFLERGNLSIGDARAVFHWTPIEGCRDPGTDPDDAESLFRRPRTYQSYDPEAPAVGRTVGNNSALKEFRDAIYTEFEKRFPLYRRPR